jgi:hypothetical protein
LIIVTNFKKCQLNLNEIPLGIGFEDVDAEASTTEKVEKFIV